jgi:CubicO group peptidase (beta-lactamase class C family)
MLKRTVPVVCTFVIVAAAGLGLWAQGAATADAKIDKVFSRWTRETPGCAVGASVNGTTVVQKAYGMADLEHDVPNAADTIFEAGSVSKQFTAASVLLLARDGKLSLDDSIRKYFPEIPDYGTPITIRHILTHSSGLRDWGSVAAIGGWPRTTREYTHAHVLDIISRQKALNFTPGSHYSYSNSGYNLAAMLVARVSGMPFAEFSRARIFEPLGMTRTSWRDNHHRIVKGRAIAYTQQGSSFEIEMPFENVHGNGGLLTTVGDLLKWNQNFVTPKVGDAAFVKLQQETGRFTSGAVNTYAFGLQIGTYKGVREVGHSGSTAGYRAHLVRYPDQNVSVAVLCNASSGNATQSALAVADDLLGPALKPDAPRAQPIPETRGPLAALQRDDSYKPTAAGLAPFAGRYESDEAEASWAIVVDGPALILRRRPGPEASVALRPRLKDTFDAPGIGTIVFRRDGPAGSVRELSVIQDRVWDLRFQRMASPPGSTK